MIASAEYAREDVSSLFIVQHTMVIVGKMIELVPSKRTRNGLNDIYTSILEIVSWVQKTYEGLIIDPSNCWNNDSAILWGEAFLRLAFKYLDKEDFIGFFGECRVLAHQKFVLAKSILRERDESTINQKMILYNAMGYNLLIDALLTENDFRRRNSSLKNAIQYLTEGENMSSSWNSSYNLACCYVLLDDHENAAKYLEIAVSFTNDSSTFINDPIFLKCRNNKWYKDIISKFNFSPGLEESFILYSSKKDPAQHMKYSEDEELDNYIRYDENLNALQASLKREGFSDENIIEMLLDLAKEKISQETKDRDYETNRKRLNERLSSLGMKEKTDIPADGNCQFSAVSDQLYNNIRHSQFVRRSCVEWLRNNRQWELDNGTTLEDYCYGTGWDDYCDELARDGIWGNHVTLIALSECFKVKIKVISSIEGGNYMTEIVPTKILSNKVVMLSHYAEYHYSSVTFTNQ
eukprot:TRINITY_DN228_c0_g1_i1.p1 TRINITY_DN228_c0_g1~~TRINITY_DN228_c0_g1_i1.p1  ORF type:complete len:464 (-),score=93.17 TRINITY_DN228_c0_g1_i1:48-1439(-)